MKGLQENKLLKACREYISLCEKGEASKVDLEQFRAGIAELEKNRSKWKIINLAKNYATKKAPLKDNTMPEPE